MKIHYRNDLKEVAKKLRSKMTLSETLLWNRLKGKQLLGFDFDRQKPMLSYVVDFYCYELKLIIEIDGFSHDFKMEYDALRQEQLEALGYSVLRFHDLDVKKDIDNVIQRIVDLIGQHTPAPSGPPLFLEGTLRRPPFGK